MDTATKEVRAVENVRVVSKEHTPNLWDVDERAVVSVSQVVVPTDI